MQPKLTTNQDEETVMSLEDDLLRVDLVNLGEGLNGDYDPEDPTDVNLLRFDVYTACGSSWEPVDDGSCCTMMEVGTDPVVLERALRFLFCEYRDVIVGYPERSVKRLSERLSWITESEFVR